MVKDMIFYLKVVNFFVNVFNDFNYFVICSLRKFVRNNYFDFVMRDYVIERINFGCGYFY